MTFVVNNWSAESDSYLAMAQPAAPAKEVLAGITFGVTVPTEFTLKKHVPMEGMDTLVWAAPRAIDAPGRPVFEISVNDSVDNLPGTVSLSNIAQFLLDSKAKRWQGFQQSELKVVRINGQPFAAAKWQGQKPALGAQTIYGIQYVTRVGSKVIAIVAQDPSPSRVFLVKCDAAAQTFKLHL